MPCLNWIYSSQTHHAHYAGYDEKQEKTEKICKLYKDHLQLHHHHPVARVMYTNNDTVPAVINRATTTMDKQFNRVFEAEDINNVKFFFKKKKNFFFCFVSDFDLLFFQH